MTVLLLLGATALWGVWGYANKIAVSHAHPFHVQWAYSLPLALLIPLWFILGRSQRPEGALNTTAFLWAVGSGLAAAGAFALMLFALQTTSATAVVALTAAYPVVTALLAYFTGTERLTAGQGIALIVIVAGIVLFEVTGREAGG